MSIAASPSALQPREYDEIEVAVMETARGRAFLAQYARRARAADTDGLRVALARIEARLDALGAPPQTEAVPVLERLDALVWSLREGGVDDFVCARIEALAREIAAYGLRIDAPATPPPEALPQHMACDAVCEPITASSFGRSEIETEGAAPQAGGQRPATSLMDEAEARSHSGAARIADSPSSIDDESAEPPPTGIDPRLEALLWLDGLPILDRMALFA